MSLCIMNKPPMQNINKDIQCQYQKQNIY